LQQIGEGGMGTVWMAEQMEPVRRTVALKVVKAGLDSAQVVARFEAERQALALMDHPNIAKVLDAGTTEAGRPYFVMELVKGTPITKYCDAQRLPLRERLELFIPVCQALQHAHQKGIIHRDIKPSNVLIAPYDGKPVVKVIDFGVAKATGQRLTDKTMFTEFGAVIGTLEYMSPEQAELNNQDIDTRSDIYALGVLLYQLLTGTTPLNMASLRTGAMRLRGHSDEILDVAFAPSGRELLTVANVLPPAAPDAVPIGLIGRFYGGLGGGDPNDDRLGGLRILTGSLVGFGVTGQLDGISVPPFGGPAWEVKRWDMDGGCAVATRPGHTARLTCAAFSPKADRVAVGAMDNTLRVWDTHTGREVVAVAVSGPPTNLAFDPRGDFLAVLVTEEDVSRILIRSGTWPAAKVAARGNCPGESLACFLMPTVRASWQRPFPMPGRLP
jgi:hypothetical protein